MRTRSLAAALTVATLFAPPADVQAAAPAAGWDGGFFIRSTDDAFLLRVRPRLDLRWTLGLEDEGGDETSVSSQFAVQRARLTFDGHAFGEDLTYALQVDFARGFVTLKDAYLDYALAPELHLRGGQFKRPYSRQQITSSSRLAFVTRALTDAFFPAGRDIGLMLHNDFTRSPTFEWALGVFNGVTPDGVRLRAGVELDPETQTGQLVKPSFSNTPALFEPALVARVGYNHGKLRGYSEADLEGGPLRFGVALSGLAMLDADGDGRSAVSGELDWIVKASGFSTNGGLYVTSRQDGGAFNDRALDAWGFHLQAGWVIADRYQPGLRYAYVEREGGNDWDHEALVGLSVYWRDHALKWQTDGGLVAYHDVDGDAVVDRTDWVMRSQLLVAF